MTYNSPVTPTGTGCRRESRTIDPLPRDGPPIVTGAPGASGELIPATTVVSVGPYALNMRRPAAVPGDGGVTHCRTSSGGQTSPPVATHTRSGSASASTDASAAGVTNAWVTRSRRSSAVNSAPP
ncbi:hypothetical protein GCM10023094_48840 [Rhodococcus olei]|uniref:Uncharacterized protein n=1 Tax=Rhodococcus olei TaxID=2161675 RepID=A0ABP8PK90_9NOCA